MAKRKSAGVSMDPEFELKAKARARELGFSTFSAYVNQLIRADLLNRGPMILSASEEPSAYHSGGAPVKKTPKSASKAK